MLEDVDQKHTAYPRSLSIFGRPANHSKFGLAGNSACCGQPSGLEFHQKGTRNPIFAVTKIRTKARHNRSWRSSVSSWRCDASRPAEVGDIGGAVVVLEPVGEVLAGHVVGGDRDVPCLERVTGVLGEVGRARGCGCSVDGRQQDQIAAGVVDAPATECKRVAVAVEPEPVVGHEAEEALLGTAFAIPVAAYAASALAACVAGQRHGSFADEGVRTGVILILDAVVGVVA